MPCIPKSRMIRKIDMKEEAQTWQKVRNMISSLI